MSRNALADSSLLAGLVDYWTLDEASGNRVGVKGTVLTPQNSPGNATGKLGNGVGLDGVNQYLLFADAGKKFSPGSGDFTVWAWFKLSAFTTAYTVVGRHKAVNGSREWRISLDNVASRAFVLWSTDGTAQSSLTAPGDLIQVGQWQFVAVTKSGSAISISVNGGKAATGTVSGGAVFQSPDALFEIGADSNASRNLPGVIDGAGYANRAYSPAEIALLWNNGNGLEYPWTRGLVTSTQPRVVAATSSLLTGLTDYWKLEESAGNCVGVNGTLLSRQGNISPARAAGKLGFGQSFPATDTSRLQIFPLDATSFSPGMGSFSVSAWANLVAIGADRQVMSKFKSLTGGFEWRLYMQTAGGDHWRFQIVNDSAATVNALADGPLNKVVAGQWYHLVGTWNIAEQKLRLYINGALATTVNASAAFASSGIFVGNGNFLVGNVTAASNSADGVVDAPGYWSRALTLSEVLLLWNNGNGLEHPFGRGQLTSSLLRAAA